MKFRDLFEYSNIKSIEYEVGASVGPSSNTQTKALRKVPKRVVYELAKVAYPRAKNAELVWYLYGNDMIAFHNKKDWRPRNGYFKNEKVVRFSLKYLKKDIISDILITTQTVYNTYGDYKSTSEKRIGDIDISEYKTNKKLNDTVEKVVKGEHLPLAHIEGDSETYDLSIT